MLFEFKFPSDLTALYYTINTVSYYTHYMQNFVSFVCVYVLTINHNEFA